MEKTLTISIAAYNVENYIRQTLDSLIDEEIIEELEIFVVDDGGTDRTLEIAQEYANRYPQSIFPVHKENGGYGSTINTGIERATGKYFKQLDGDDWYQTENLKELLAVMRSVSVDCVLTDFFRYNEATGETEYKTFYGYMKEGEYLLAQSGIDDRLSMYASAFRTTLLKEMPNRLTQHCFYTDIEYSALPLPYIDSIYVLHKAIYVYRIGAEGQSMSVSGIAKHYKEHETVFWRLVDIYRIIPEEREINRKIFRYLLETRLKEHYQFLCILPDSSAAKREVSQFNRKVKAECPEILEHVAARSRTIRMLSGNPGFAFSFCSNRIKRNWKQEGRL